MNGNGYEANPHSEYADLDHFGQAAAPERSFRPGLETVANGDYDCEVTSAALDRVAGSRVLRLGLRLGARTIEHVYWLNRQESVNAFLAEMASAGFPAHQWGAGPGKTPLSVAIPQVAAQLKGLKLRATKTSRVVPAKPAAHGQAERKEATYHDLFFSGRITGSAMPTGAQAHATPQSAQPLETASLADLPF